MANAIDVCYYCYVCLGFTRHPLRHCRFVAIFVILTLRYRINGVSLRFDVSPLLEIFFGPRSQYVLKRGVNSPAKLLDKGRNWSPNRISKL